MAIPKCPYPSSIFNYGDYMVITDASQSLNAGFFGVVVCDSDTDITITLPSPGESWGTAGEWKVSRRIIVVNINVGIVTVSTTITGDIALSQYVSSVFVAGESDWVSLRTQAPEVYYDNSGGTLTSDNVMDALDELYYLVADAETEIRTGWICPFWIYADLVLEYDTATTITTSADLTDLIKPFNKVKYYQNDTLKYGYVYSITDSLITLVPNDDYEVEDADITDFYISKIESPDDFPQYFNYTPDIAPSAGAITSYAVNGASFKIDNGLVTAQCDIEITDNGTGSGSVEIDGPLAAKTGTASQMFGSRSDNKALCGTIGDGTDTMSVYLYDGTYPGATGVDLRVTAIYWPD